jgi:hypothetical protein
VLNAGSSTKDVDVYFLPMDDGAGKSTTDTDGLLGWLEQELGPSKNLIGDGYSPGPGYVAKLAYRKTAKRIDVFVTKG